MNGLDDLDLRLIGLLRDDGRLPTATLARRLGVSRGTVQNRMDRLMRDGVILGFAARLRSEAARGAVRAIVCVELRSADMRAVVAALRRMPDVGRVHSTNGRWDLIAELGTRTLEDLDNVLLRVRGFEGVLASETSLLLSTRRPGRR